MKVVKAYRIDLQLWKKAKVKAEMLGRSLSGQIRYLLQKFIEEK